MGFKLVEVLPGDTLQRLSLREMGNASHWVDIALLNGLRPPYLVDTGGGDGLAVAGSSILIPIDAINAVADTEDQFLTDLILNNGSIDVIDGDISLISGVDNLVQALRHRVIVMKRSLWFHPEYGCWVHTLIGEINGQTAGGLAAFYVKSSVLEDVRVKSVESISADILGDTIRVSCVVLPVYGESIAYDQIF